MVFKRSLILGNNGQSSWAPPSKSAQRYRSSMVLAESEKLVKNSTPYHYSISIIYWKTFKLFVEVKIHAVI